MSLFRRARRMAGLLLLGEKATAAEAVWDHHRKLENMLERCVDWRYSLPETDHRKPDLLLDIRGLDVAIDEMRNVTLPTLGYRPKREDER